MKRKEPPTDVASPNKIQKPERKIIIHVKDKSFTVVDLGIDRFANGEQFHVDDDVASHADQAIQIVEDTLLTLQNKPRIHNLDHLVYCLLIRWGCKLHAFTIPIIASTDNFNILLKSEDPRCLQSFHVMLINGCTFQNMKEPDKVMKMIIQEFKTLSDKTVKHEDLYRSLYNHHKLFRFYTMQIGKLPIDLYRSITTLPAAKFPILANTQMFDFDKMVDVKTWDPKEIIDLTLMPPDFVPPPVSVSIPTVQLTKTASLGINVETKTSEALPETSMFTESAGGTHKITHNGHTWWCSPMHLKRNCRIDPQKVILDERITFTDIEMALRLVHEFPVKYDGTCRAYYVLNAFGAHEITHKIVQQAKSLNWPMIEDILATCNHQESVMAAIKKGILVTPFTIFINPKNADAVFKALTDKYRQLRDIAIRDIKTYWPYLIISRMISKEFTKTAVLSRDAYELMLRQRKTHEATWPVKIDL